METTKEEVYTSKPGEMGRLAWSRWFLNTLRFLLPVLSIYLGFVSTNLADGFSSFDFIPNNFVFGTMSLYVVNTIQDFITKYSTENKYITGKEVK